mmetsp:Transcript_51944/g.121617  ORF Transcript_51944/g.121617 Transcript_51944/m.121617 type:complete len:324 (+) Transcript_51944:74-1045(+)
MAQVLGQMPMQLHSSPWLENDLAGAGMSLSHMVGADVMPSMSAPPAHQMSTITWQMVWCYERCHKSENQEQRQVIKKYARAAGASLVCLKKARQFCAWIERSKRPPFVLITDWREAQPCLRAVTQHGGSNIPSHMVVLCEGRRQYMRALDWSKVLRPDIGMVHICEKTNIPDWLLDGVIKRCFTPVAQGGEAFGDASSNTSPIDDDEGMSDDNDCLLDPRVDMSPVQRSPAHGMAQDLHMHIDAATNVAKLSASSIAPPRMGYMAGLKNVQQNAYHEYLDRMASTSTLNSQFDVPHHAPPLLNREVYTAYDQEKYVVVTHLSL